MTLTIFWFLPESPQFFYAKGRYDECKQVLLTIAKTNGTNVKPEQFQFDIQRDDPRLEDPIGIHPGGRDL